MIHFDTRPEELEEIEELSGHLSSQNEEQKLMHSILDHDDTKIDDGKLISSSLNQGMSSFVPDVMFEKLTSHYQLAQQLYGETLLRLATGYNPDYLKRNIRIPEFRKELQQRIISKHDDLQDKGFLSKDNDFTDKGVLLASLVLYTEELDKIDPQGMYGELIHKKKFLYGSSEETRKYRKGDRYKDIALRTSIHHAIKHGHTTLESEDLHSFEKQAKGQTHVIYALDASGSMKGKKIEACKKAGVALAYKAISQKDKAGLIVFGSDVKEAIAPTNDFMHLALEMTKVQPRRETDFVQTLRKSVELFTTGDHTKHLILITDALPTKGEKPEEDTLKAASQARNAGITISVVGIKLDEKGVKLAEQISTIGGGRFHVVRNLDNLDMIVLEDYHIHT